MEVNGRRSDEIANILLIDLDGDRTAAEDILEVVAKLGDRRIAIRRCFVDRMQRDGINATP